MWPSTVSTFLLCSPFMASTTEASAAGESTGLDPVPQFPCRVPPPAALCFPTVVQVGAGCCPLVIFQPALSQYCAVSNVETKRVRSFCKQRYIVVYELSYFSKS